MHHHMALAALFVLIVGTARAQSRFPELDPEHMTPAQQQVAKNITSGPRHGMAGPFQAWLRSPELADRLQRVGEYVRFHTSIPHRLNELAILINAREWDAAFEWYAHYKIAMQAGLSPSIADAINARRRPEGMSADEALIYDFCTELYKNHAVSDATFNAVKERFGEQGVVDLLGVNGYYAAVSMTLNVAEVPAPDDPTVPKLLPR